MMSLNVRMADVCQRHGCVILMTTVETNQMNPEKCAVSGTHLLAL